MADFKEILVDGQVYHVKDETARESAGGGGEGTVTGVKVGNTTYEPTEGVVDLSTPFGGKVDKNGTDSLMTAAEHTKLSGIAAGAQVNVINGINKSDNTPLTPDSNRIVTLPPAASPIFPATAAPLEDGTAGVGASDKYAREDHVHPHDSSKLSQSDVSVETQGDGSVDINVGNDTYTINLNHSHSQYTLKKTVESNANSTVTLSADVIYDLGIVDGNKTISLPSSVDQAAEYEFRLVYSSGTITLPSGVTVANNATLTFTAGKTYQVVINGGILYFSETTVSS